MYYSVSFEVKSGMDCFSIDLAILLKRLLRFKLRKRDIQRLIFCKLSHYRRQLLSRKWTLFAFNFDGFMTTITLEFVQETKKVLIN